jgi:hypothetical protein
VFGLALGISPCVSSAATINFVEGLEGTLVNVTTNLTGPTGTGSAPTISVTPETASVDGFHFPAISPSPVFGGAAGMTSAGLVEFLGGPLSDLVIVQALAITDCQVVGLCQELRISFFSDVEGGPPLESLLPNAGTFGGSLVENGMLQDLSALLNTLPEGLIVKVQSDAPEVPEPASLTLLTVGLCGLGFIWRKRRVG